MALLLTGKYFLLLFSIAQITFSKELNDDCIVHLKEGKIRGHILESGIGYDYYAFQEIPYAAPPVGKNRFQLPKKVDPWKGILNTTKNTKMCYQEVIRATNLTATEDCLYANVYTPVKPHSSKKLPVLVWIHGGAYLVGSGASEFYGPKYLIDFGVVVVTFNYRLGPFGFGTTNDDTIPANIALKDQRFALEWVNENIHLFAGDPQRVTLAGESAGSFSVGLQLMGQWNKQKELFHAIIMESGSPLGGLLQVNARENLLKCGRTLDNKFVSNSSSDLLKVLQAASAAAILEACSDIHGTFIEKDGDFSRPPLQSFMDGHFRKVPILMGFNSEEWIRDALLANESTLTTLDNHPERLVPWSMNMSPENRSFAGKLLKKVYTNSSFKEDLGAYCRWLSDSEMITAICKQAELAASQVPVYFYQFSYHGELGQGTSTIIPGAERVGHLEEMHYLWETSSNSDMSKFPQADRLTSRRMLNLWTNFIKHRNPTPQDDPLFFHVKWTTTNSENLSYLNINATLEMREYPRRFVDVRAILDEYMEPPLDYY